MSHNKMLDELELLNPHIDKAALRELLFTGEAYYLSAQDWDDESLEEEDDG